MSTSLQQENQKVARDLAVARGSMEVRELLKDYATRVARSSRGMTSRDRQWLYDIKRDRVDIANTVRFFELVTLAGLPDALGGLEMFRGYILAVQQPPIPNWIDASRGEEVSNHRGNLAQHVWHETRSRSAADSLCEAMLGQEIASRMLADAVHVASTGTRFIHVVSR